MDLGAFSGDRIPTKNPYDIYNPSHFPPSLSKGKNVPNSRQLSERRGFKFRPDQRDIAATVTATLTSSHRESDKGLFWVLSYVHVKLIALALSVHLPAKTSSMKWPRP